MSLQETQQEWAKLDGLGPRAMEIKGQPLAQAITAAMDAFADKLQAQYGVKVNELHWQRGKDEGPSL